jgi:hypothetical protein
VKDKRENKPEENAIKSVLPVPDLIKASVEEVEKPAEEPAKLNVKSEIVHHDPKPVEPHHDKPAEEHHEHHHPEKQEAIALKSDASPAVAEKVESEHKETLAVKKLPAEKTEEHKEHVEHEHKEAENKEKVVPEKQ